MDAAQHSGDKDLCQRQVTTNLPSVEAVKREFYSEFGSTITDEVFSKPEKSWEKGITKTQCDRIYLKAQKLAKRNLEHNQNLWDAVCDGKWAHRPDPNSKTYPILSDVHSIFYELTQNKLNLWEVKSCYHKKVENSVKEKLKTMARLTPCSHGLKLPSHTQLSPKVLAQFFSDSLIGYAGRSYFSRFQPITFRTIVFSD